MCNEDGVVCANSDSEVCKVIIEFNDVNKMHEQLIERFGTITNYLPMINSYVVELPKQHVHKLKLLKNVMSVSEDTHITAQMNNGRRAVNADSAHKCGLSGKGVAIAFLDTGVAPIDDFVYPVNRIIGFKDFVNGHGEAYDDNGHGTHVGGS